MNSDHRSSLKIENHKDNLQTLARLTLPSLEKYLKDTDDIESAVRPGYLICTYRYI